MYRKESGVAAASPLRETKSAPIKPRGRTEPEIRGRGVRQKGRKRGQNCFPDCNESLRFCSQFCNKFFRGLCYNKTQIRKKTSSPRCQFRGRPTGFPSARRRKSAVYIDESKSSRGSLPRELLRAESFGFRGRGVFPPERISPRGFRVDERHTAPFAPKSRGGI